MKKILSLFLLISVFLSWNLSARQESTNKQRNFNSSYSMQNASPANDVEQVNVTITMNSTSRNITFTSNSTGETVNVGEMNNTPKNYSYNFKAEPGIYTLAAFTSEESGKLPNGTLEITITEDSVQTFNICTATAGATNSGWVLDTDYAVEYSAVSREGVLRVTTPGTSTTANKMTFLMHVGDTYTVEYVPSEEKALEGYMTYTGRVTVTNTTTNIGGAVPMGHSYSVTVPKDAKLFIGKKYAHYVAFSEVEPSGSEEVNNKTTYDYYLAQGQVYNYRVSQSGKLTTAGKFTMSSTLDPLEITEETLNIDHPKRIDHDVNSNAGYNVGDIFLNINERGHLKMNVGDEYRTMSMRNWQLTDNITNNYFFEPDFHYTIVNENGVKDNSILSIDENGKIKALSNGTAIVLVTYDAMYVPDCAGGPFFGAIWPENTGVFVVTVGQSDSGITSNMVINETLNSEALKLAGSAVDAEHDVFYYLNNEEGYDYTFKPEGVTSVTMAHPVVGESMTTYNGFSGEGVTKNDDGSYTVRLIHGRNIVKLTASNGNSEYQVFTAKATEYEVRNKTNPGEQIQAGDKISIVFKDLYHPANKLAAVYNMSAYIQYNDKPNGTSLIQTGNQYAFGSSESAKTITLDVPKDWDISQKLILSDGVIQVNGFGDPIGNHRNTPPDLGRNANFNAVSHKTYFGSIPSVSVTIHETDYYTVNFTGLPEETEFALYDSNNERVEPQEDGSYKLTYGSHAYTIKSNGYRMLRDNIVITSESPESQSIEISMTPLSSNGWDGVTLTQPVTVTTEEAQTTGGVFEGMEGYYKISSGYELAWFANEVNTVDTSVINAILINDIDLANYQWTPIGKNTMNTNALRFKGIFEGADYTVEGLYIEGQKSYWALFGCIEGATIRDLSVKGDVIVEIASGTTNYYFAGLAAWGTGAFTIENCHNYVNVTGGGYTAGILAYSNSADFILNNCSNHGNISGSTNVGGIMGYITSLNGTTSNLYNVGNIKGSSSNAGGIVANLTSNKAIIQNAFNTGEVKCSNANNTGSIKGAGSGAIENVYSLYEYNDRSSVNLTTEEELASGKIAWLLGEAFGQVTGTDPLPSFNAEKVYKIDYTSNLEWRTETIYINRNLPAIEKEGYTSAWHTDPDGEVITEVTEDSTLYILYTPIRVESITINKQTAELKVQETVQLEVTINPENALNKEVIWTSSNPEVASVDDTGLVTALTTGTTTILVISEDGRFVERCEITVVPDPIPVEGVQLNQEEAELAVNETLQLTATIEPADADNQDVIWESSNPEIATVNASGLVNALTPGKTTITVKTVDGNFTATCEVTVKTGVGIDNPELTANVYPNPVRDRLFIDNNGIIISKITITDVKGNLVYGSDVNQSKLELPVAHWTEGMYLMQITSENQSKNYKLLKVK